MVSPAPLPSRSRLTRFRYTAVNSVPKVVALMIDTSGSMNNFARMPKAIEAAKTVLSTLGPDDWIFVQPFKGFPESPPKSCFESVVVPQSYRYHCLT